MIRGGTTATDTVQLHRKSDKNMSKKLSAEDLYVWATRAVRKRGFTTGEVVSKFNISPTSAAAFIAILRRRSQLRSGKAEGGVDGTSHWMAVHV